eukprot:GHVT01008425.1.p1 GENE.GHVT01008425.1~~GHVT01008425.1.p1  ORF type:complete len:185 (-),score=27.45 GHVT01008425.1:1301-1855(-)
MPCEDTEVFTPDHHAVPSSPSPAVSPSPPAPPACATNGIMWKPRNGRQTGEAEIHFERTYKPVFLPFDSETDKTANCALLAAKQAEYPHKPIVNRTGSFQLSPEYQEGEWMYRHVYLHGDVKQEAQRLVLKSPTGFLSDFAIRFELGIVLSGGWEHCMVFKGTMDVLVLRRRRDHIRTRQRSTQ